ncbi:conjugal transfer protein TraF [Vibrio cyclitrophicus]|uniref:Conjugal transfer protein TraF n=3 Tax=Vibrionaceae TaxID=641 RepID=A0ACD5G444_9VIBR
MPEWENMCGDMNNKTLKKATLALALIASMPNISVAEDSRPGFYDRKAEGWFFYEVEPEEKEVPKPKPVAVQPPPPPPEQEQMAQSEGPEYFSAAWFRENLPKYKDAWWDNPTIENAKAFAYMQRFAMDRSEQAQDAYELAILGDPYLDEVSRRPYATFASQQVDSKAGKERQTLLGTVASRVGLFFFYQPNCEMCEIQAPIVKMLEQGYGFTVVAVSSDGTPFPGNIFPEFKVDNGHAEQLGVVTYPALFLASPDGSFAPVGQGVMSLPDTANRILVTARRAGWISDDEFNKTRALVNTDNNIAEILTDKTGEVSLEEIMTDDKGNYIPPEQLMDFIREKIKEK